MSEHKFTPGPWEVIGAHVYTKLGAKNRAGSQAADTDGWNVATISPWACTNADGEDEDMPVTESMANAQLIAAAPDLLDALEAMLAQFNEQMTGAVNDELAAMSKARAAIAKALGNQ